MSKKSKDGDCLPFLLPHQLLEEYTTPFPRLLHLTLDTYLIMLSVKYGGIKYHFLSLWYNSTWNWTSVSRAYCEHYMYISTYISFYIHKHTHTYIYIYIYIVIHRQICFVLSELISVSRQYLPGAGIETRLTQTSNQSF